MSVRRGRALRQNRTFVILAAAIVLLGALSGCRRVGPVYEVEIVRTSHDIAHIVADDLGSLGFGDGYAQAQDHACTILDEVVKVRGERAKYFGRGDGDVHFMTDALYRGLRMHALGAADLAAAPEEIREWIGGFARGINYHLREVGPAGVTGWCQGADWIREVGPDDIAAYFRSVIVIEDDGFGPAIVSAAPPGVSDPVPSAALADVPLVQEMDLASNGWALGSERTSNGRGMLIANPHYPWQGSRRFWEKHLTIPGELDVYGVQLIGVPGVSIGFNEHVGWTHTVSAGIRYTIYSLDLVEGDPLSYRYDDEIRPIEKRTIDIDVLGDDGTVSKVSHDLYFSHYGPIVNLPGFGWTDERAYAVRDANRENDEALEQWLAMDRAGSLDELKAAHATHNAVPWVNTMAASADGRAWYADGSATPHLTQEAIDAWRDATQSDPATKIAWDSSRAVLLDGSNSLFEWSAADDARDPGVLPFSLAPQLERSDYIFNANDSHWIANSAAPIEGHSPMSGAEREAISMRTRQNDSTLSDLSPDGPAGADAKFTLEELSAAALSNESFAAQTLLPEIVERCEAQSRVALDGRSVDLTEACDVLADFHAAGARYDVDARGAVLFRELISQYPRAALRAQGELFANAFDPTDPIGTPGGLAPASSGSDGALTRLARAVTILESAGLALGVPLGEVQFAQRGEHRVPIHGGDGGAEGIENVVRYSPNRSTLEPEPAYERVEGSQWLTTAGYPITGGTSFLLALEYTDDGPNAQAFLTYGQSGDPTSEFFVDQTKLFSQKAWRPALFRRADIEADAKSRQSIVAPR